MYRNGAPLPTRVAGSYAFALPWSGTVVYLREVRATQREVRATRSEGHTTDRHDSTDTTDTNDVIGHVWCDQ